MQRSERVSEGTGGSRRAPLIYSGRELMYGPLLDVVGAFHSAASLAETRDNLASDQRSPLLSKGPNVT